MPKKVRNVTQWSERWLTMLANTNVHKPAWFPCSCPITDCLSFRNQLDVLFFFYATLAPPPSAETLLIPIRFGAESEVKPNKKETATINSLAVVSGVRWSAGMYCLSQLTANHLNISACLLTHYLTHSLALQVTSSLCNRICSPFAWHRSRRDSFPMLLWRQCWLTTVLLGKYLHFITAPGTETVLVRFNSWYAIEARRFIQFANANSASPYPLGAFSYLRSGKYFN